MTVPLQAVDLTRVLVYLLPMALLIGLYLLLVFGRLPGRVTRLERRVDELEAELDDGPED